MILNCVLLNSSFSVTLTVYLLGVADWDFDSALHILRLKSILDAGEIQFHVEKLCPPAGNAPVVFYE